MPITGWLADRIGSRRLFLISVTLFVLASMLCGLAQNLEEMVIFRALQGVRGRDVPAAFAGEPGLRGEPEEAGGAGVLGVDAVAEAAEAQPSRPPMDGGYTESLGRPRRLHRHIGLGGGFLFGRERTELTADARIGKPRDRELLDFAIECLIDCNRSAGIRITTGQDLGHGTMSDGRTASLQYLNRGFRGSVVADTSKPTGEGNYFVLVGMLRAFELSLRQATIGLIGAGNIGMHVAQRVRGEGARAVAVELRPERRAQLAVDLYNALNANPIESYNQAFIANGAWLTPTGILTARFAKITAQFDF